MFPASFDESLHREVCLAQARGQSGPQAINHTAVPHAGLLEFFLLLFFFLSSSFLPYRRATKDCPDRLSASREVNSLVSSNAAGMPAWKSDRSSIASTKRVWEEERREEDDSPQAPLERTIGTSEGHFASSSGRSGGLSTLADPPCLASRVSGRGCPLDLSNWTTQLHFEWQDGSKVISLFVSDAVWEGSFCGCWSCGVRR